MLKKLSPILAVFGLLLPSQAMARVVHFPLGRQPALGSVSVKSLRLAAPDLLRSHGLSSTEWKTSSTQAFKDGVRVLRWQQYKDGIPILAAQTVMAFDNQGRLLGGSSETPDRQPRSGDPRITGDQAAGVARQAAAEGVSAQVLSTDRPRLVYWDASLIGAGGPGPRLSWQVGVHGRDRDRTIIVDAALGKAVFQIDQRQEAKIRQICDAFNSFAQVPCANPVRAEGDSPGGNGADVNSAYDLSGGVYDFYFNHFARDSIDGQGMALKSTVRWCENPAAGEPCPYQNAYWSGSQMVYGQDYAGADDVVGHEMTHGVTERTAGLFYWGQPGAINESLSDIMGEIFDLQNGSGSDEASDRWKIGEDLPASLGIIRDMKNPPAYDQPDKLSSPLFYYGQYDSGGVHYNSGVINKAAYLMADGDGFNGQTISGIGLDKTARLFYDVNTQLLRSGSDFKDLAKALQDACAAQVGSNGFVQADCTQVGKAIAAVEMNQEPTGDPLPRLADCPTGKAAGSVSLDNFSNPLSGKWASTNLQGTAYWFYSDQTNPWGFDAHLSNQDGHNIWAYPLGSASDSVFAQTANIQIPNNGLLKISHLLGFERTPVSTPGGPAVYNDGGMIEYSTDGGASWHDITDIPGVNPQGGYTGTINPADTSNPQHGRAAFVGSNGQVGDSLFNLSSLAGQNVRFRLRMASDDFDSPYINDYGWFIDSFKVYNCYTPDLTAPTTTLTPLGDQLVNNADFSLSFSASEAASFECRADSGAWSACVSPHIFHLSEGSHQLWVRASDSSGNLETSPPHLNVTVDLTKPTSGFAKPFALTRLHRLVLATRASETLSGLQWNLDGVGWQPAFKSSNNWPVNILNAADGKHTLRLLATDLAGNIQASPTTMVFVVDSRAPRVRFSLPRRITSSRLTLRFAANERAVFKCWLDRSRPRSCRSPWRVSRLRRGVHRFGVIATDRAGNSSKTSVRFRRR